MKAVKGLWQVTFDPIEVEADSAEDAWHLAVEVIRAEKVRVDIYEKDIIITENYG